MTPESPEEAIRRLATEAARRARDAVDDVRRPPFRAEGTDPKPGGRPGEVAYAERLARELAGSGVQGVVCSWVDTAGINRIKTVPARRLPSAVAWGVGMSPVFDTFLADDSIVSTDVLGSPDGDLRLYPDLDRLTPLAGQPGWAWAPVDRLTQDGEAHAADTRTLLRRQVRAAAERGLEFKAAYEIEFALGRDNVPAGEFVPACLGPAYGMTRLVEVSSFAADLLAALAQEGVEADQVHPEYAAGQFEISVGAVDPVAAADRSVLVRQTVRAVAQNHGLRVSFAPSVLAGFVGNGGHVHLSAWRDGQNLHSGGAGRYGLTPDGEAFIAGILAELPALSAVSTPSPSSYLRLVPSHWAGAFAVWGHETRESALRLVTGMVGQRDRAANIEVKCADLAANPYLLLASLIAAGLAGIDERRSLPEEITGDPARFDAEEQQRRGIRRLPQSLGEATDAFAGSALLKAALGSVLHDAVVAVRRGESARTADLEPDDVAAAYRWVY
jgi:glutamine synthetase